MNVGTNYLKRKPTVLIVYNVLWPNFQLQTHTQVSVLTRFLQTGDNIFGSSSVDAAESMLRAFGPAIDSGVPWAAVLGNHDQESTMTREELMSFISLMHYSVSQVNPLAEDLSKGGSAKNIDGFGNYDLKVYGAPGSYLANTSILNLFFLDSGDRETVEGVQTYGWIKESQLHWLRDVSQGFQVYFQQMQCIRTMRLHFVSFVLMIMN